MQLRPEQLAAHLQSTLAPIYLVSGEVPLLMQEACDAIRMTASQRGYSERQILQAEAGFAWTQLTTAAQTLSLFSEKQLLEIRVTGGQVGDAGSKALQAYAEHLPADKILLLVMGKLESSSQRTNWFQTLLKVGAIIQIWPIDITQLPRWVAQRLAAAGLQAEETGIQLLAERAEGNLLAAAQEIEKLRLLYGSGKLTAEDIAQAMSDSARFDVFTLSDAALQGDSKRVMRILTGLQEEGVEPTIVLWALAREIRSLAVQSYILTQGVAVEKILQEQKVWEKRKPLVRAALQRHSFMIWRQLLQQASNVDRTIKGLIKGNVWDMLAQLSLAITGKKIVNS